MTNECGEKAKEYLCDGKVQPDIDDDSEEQNVESSHHQQWLLQHEHLVERVVDLGKGTNKEDWFPQVCKDSDTWEQQRGLSRPIVMQTAPHTPRGDYAQSPTAQGGKDKESQVPGSQDPVLCGGRHKKQSSGATHHYVLNVLFHQVFLIGNNHRAAKRVQVSVVQLIWGPTDFIGTINLDVPGRRWE